jgi:uncharacterized repeat protein (TIGR01451 family)/CSLREA domain-containing protein
MAERGVLTRRGFAGILVSLLVTSLAGAALPAQAAPTAGHTYTVNSTLDEPDGNAADGVCFSFPSGKCTLRAAIMESNFAAGPNTIILPPGVYRLTQAGDDDAALVGDLDIGHDVTIQGAGSAATIVDGNGALTHDRVFQVLGTAQNVTLSGLTIRNGQALSEAGSVAGGGGLAVSGVVHLLLSDVVIENNTAIQQGGGLYAALPTGSSLEMDQVVLRANTAVPGSAHNPAGEGGGAWVSASAGSGSLAMHDSQVYSNTAADMGGGLTVGVPSTLERSAFYSNTASYGGGVEVESALSLFDSRVHDNHATYYGGGVHINFGAPAVISQTTLAANSAGLLGGGVYMLEHLNDTPGLTIVQSTVSGNFSSQDGGGIYNYGDGTFISSALVLINSTVSGNGADHDGGGLYSDAGQTELFNVTLADNRVLPRIGHADLGGGLFLTDTAVLTAEDTLIADNVLRTGLGVPSDCNSNASTVTLLYSLMTDTANCPLSPPTTGDILGQEPLLGPLADNGGSTQTQALGLGSPAIDAGEMPGCSDGAGGTLATDQRGAPRTLSRCDMGAYEVVPQADLAVSQRDNPDPVRPGAPLTYTLVLTNAGPDTASDVSLSDTLPAGAAWRASLPSQGSCLGTITVTCHLGSLASSAELTVTLAVTSTAAGVMTNVVSAAANEFDPTLANNTASETTTVLRELYLPLLRRGP